MRKWLRKLGLAGYVLAGLTVAVFLIPQFGIKALTVLTGSMRPEIQPGTIVLVHKVAPTSLRVGQVITYINPADPKETITHRIVALTNNHGLVGVTTKGDANTTVDREFAAGRVVGTEFFAIPFLGRIAVWLHSTVALMSVILIPGFIVIIYETILLNKRLAEFAAAEGRPKQRVVDAIIAPIVAPARRRINLDGVTRLGVAVVIVSGLIIANGATHSSLHSQVVLTHNTISTCRAPSPSSSPSTGAGSTNTSTTTTTTTTNVTNTNDVTVFNLNHQWAGSGDANSNGNTNTGNTSSGSASNSNSTSTTITITNGSPSPSPSVSPSPSPSVSPSPSPSVSPAPTCAP